VRSALATTAALCLLALAGCGGSDETQSKPEPLTAAKLLAICKANPQQPFCAARASSGVHGGFDAPSNSLELTFKLALLVRTSDPNGCYPTPAELIPLIRQVEHLRAGIVPSDEAVQSAGIVNVIGRRTNCNRLRMGYLAPDGLYVLDTDEGPVQPPGLALKQNLAGGVENLSSPTLVSDSVRMKGPNETQRLAVNCPAGTYPLGGGMTSSPPVGSDGEGVYPHSYERLGVQRGWHISATLIDPTPANTTGRHVAIQAVCASGLIPATPSPHRSVFILPGQTKSVTASCPSGQYLFGGGFQRTDFRNFGLPSGGGDYITESRAINPSAWRVSGHAFGGWGGELTAVAYCVAHDGPLLSAVTASAPVPEGKSATATTPRCPAGRELTSGGFSLNGSTDALFGGGSINRGAWSATAYAYFGEAPRLTAYGFCMAA
jgi:hypothetical protein